MDNELVEKEEGYVLKQETFVVDTVKDGYKRNITASSLAQGMIETDDSLHIRKKFKPQLHLGTSLETEINELDLDIDAQDGLSKRSRKNALKYVGKFLGTAALTAALTVIYLEAGQQAPTPEAGLTAGVALVGAALAGAGAVTNLCGMIYEFIKTVQHDMKHNKLVKKQDSLIDEQESILPQEKTPERESSFHPVLIENEQFLN